MATDRIAELGSRLDRIANLRSQLARISEIKSRLVCIREHLEHERGIKTSERLALLTEAKGLRGELVALTCNP